MDAGPPKLTAIPGGRSVRSPFEALVVAAEHDAEAAAGLAQAYVALEPEARRALVESIVEDARETGRAPAAALAILLAVEDNRDSAHSIAVALLESHDAPRADAAWGWGGAEEGGLAILWPVFPGSGELVVLGWRGGALSGVGRAPVGDRADLPAMRAELGVPDAAEAIGVDEAVDRLAEQIWRARREHGPLPDDLRALAPLFAPY